MTEYFQHFHFGENKFSRYGKLIFLPGKHVSYTTKAAMNCIKRIRNTIAIG